jgi:UDP-3-O-[3-hydroxymyristoyl] glucosamine N-acyltransferase
MAWTLESIAAALDAKLLGQGDLKITGAAEPASAGATDLAVAMDPKYAPGLAEGQARAAILWDGADWTSLGLEGALVVPRPRYAMSGLTRVLDPGPEIAPGIHPTAEIDPSARLGEGVCVGPFVVIGRDVKIGDGARIAAHVSIGADCRIGDNALILDGVRIRMGVTIGNGFIAQPGAVLGSDGFSFVTPEKSGVERARESLGHQGEITGQSWTRIHSLGGVEIGDDVEIGANSTVDQGTIRATRIGRGTKLDNMVHLGHNVVVGQDCLLCGQVGIAGSAVIGDRVVLGGQCGVSDNIFVGDDVVAGGATKIFTNAPAGRVLLGSPAIKMETHVEAMKNLRRLPRLFRQVAELQKRVSNSDKKS